MRVNWQSNDYDDTSLEFLFLFVKKYKAIENVLINLNSKYDIHLVSQVSDAIEVDVDEKPEWYDPFREIGVNLKILCGENGVGKSTIIEILSCTQSADDSGIYLASIDRNNVIVCNNNLRIKLNGQQVNLQKPPPFRIYSYKDAGTMRTSIHYENENSFHREILNAYTAAKGLFDRNGDSIFTHFEVDFWDLRSQSERLAKHFIKIAPEMHSYNFEKLYETSPLSFFYWVVSQDNTFDEHFKANTDGGSGEDLREYVDTSFSTKRSEFEALDAELREVIFGKDFTMPQNAFETPKHREKRLHPICDKIDVSKKIHELNSRIVEFFRSSGAGYRLHIDSYAIHSRIFYRALKLNERDNQRIYLKDLSDGEVVDLQNKYNIYPCMLQQECIWFFEDEPDNHLHPEWKRKFIAMYMETIKAIRKYLIAAASEEDKKVYADKIYTVIFTTHSPFMLSDVFLDHVILLKKSNNSAFAEKLKSSPFAGNIGEMFYEQFFMQETVGEFAKSQIKQMLDKCNAHNMTTEDARAAKNLFEKVGDKLLKKLLLERLPSNA